MSRNQNQDMSALSHEGIVSLVAIIRAVAPHQIYVSFQPVPNGWRAIAMVMGTELRFAGGANPTAAAETLFQVLLEDARKMRSALDTIITRFEGRDEKDAKSKDEEVKVKVKATVVDDDEPWPNPKKMFGGID